MYDDYSDDDEDEEQQQQEEEGLYSRHILQNAPHRFYPLLPTVMLSVVAKLKVFAGYWAPIDKRLAHLD